MGPAGGAKVKAMKNPRRPDALDSLFHRWPALVGFSVQDADSLTHDREWVRLDQGLSVADVGMHDWIGQDDRLEILSELAAALLELIDERPEAQKLLRGRTFARILH